MMRKAYWLFACVLLIAVVALASTDTRMSASEARDIRGGDNCDYGCKKKFTKWWDGAYHVYTATGFNAKDLWSPTGTLGSATATAIGTARVYYNNLLDNPTKDCPDHSSNIQTVSGGTEGGLLNNEQYRECRCKAG